MGLTINYKIDGATSDREEALGIVQKIRSLAMDLPFEKVGEIIEISGDRANHHHPDYDKGGELENYLWMALQATGFSEALGESEPKIAMAPLELIAFEIRPGPGCESANFGMCRYPATIDFSCGKGRRKKLATGFGDVWSWSSFCKTQYASDPRFGGLANFLRCHISLVTLLDRIRERLGLHVYCHDEGGYGPRNDNEDVKTGKAVDKITYKPGKYSPALLAEQVGHWNEICAALSGAIDDALGVKGVKSSSPINRFSNFEQLEFRGRGKTGNIDGFLKELLAIIENGGKKKSPKQEPNKAPKKATTKATTKGPKKVTKKATTKAPKKARKR